MILCASFLRWVTRNTYLGSQVSRYISRQVGRQVDRWVDRQVGTQVSSTCSQFNSAKSDKHEKRENNFFLVSFQKWRKQLILCSDGDDTCYKKYLYLLFTIGNIQLLFDFDKSCSTFLFNRTKGVNLPKQKVNLLLSPSYLHYLIRHTIDLPTHTHFLDTKTYNRYTYLPFKRYSFPIIGIFSLQKVQLHYKRNSFPIIGVTTL